MNLCEKLRYCNPRKDKCLITKIELINAMKVYQTLSSCCGHNKYPETIVVMDRKSKRVSLFDSPHIFLGYGRRKGNRYYKTDQENFYYIPEVSKPK